MVAQMEAGAVKERLERAIRGEDDPEAGKIRQEVLSGSQAAEVLHCTTRHIQHLAQRGIIKRVVVPGSSRGCGYLRRSVEALVGVGA